MKLKKEVLKLVDDNFKRKKKRSVIKILALKLRIKLLGSLKEISYP